MLRRPKTLIPRCANGSRDCASPRPARRAASIFRLPPHEARHNETGWEVLIDDRFRIARNEMDAVPRNRVLDQHNPIGEAIVCFLPGLGVMCFVPPPEI